jgi:hypothetical protein
MLNLKTGAQWAVLAITTLSMGLEPLAAGATLLPSASAKVTGSPMLMARSAERRWSLTGLRPSGTTQRPSKSKKQQRVLSNKPSRSGVSASAAEVEKFQSVYQAGMNVVPGCITRHNSRACSQLVESKSALTNWCLQGKTEACMLLKTLSSQEAYETMSDALQQSVQ